MKGFLARLTMLVLVILLAACSGPQPAPTEVPTLTFTPLPLTETPTPTNTPTITPSPTPTQTPTNTPTPKLPVVAGTAFPPPSGVIESKEISHIKEMARYGKGTIDSFAWSPDGKQVAVGASIGFYIYDAETFEQVQFIDTGADETHIAYSPDGKRLVGGSFDGSLHIADIEKGKVLYTLTGHEFDAEILGVAFSPDGKWIATASEDKTIILWDPTKAGRQIFVLKGHSDEVNAVAFSPDSAQIASASSDRTVRIWNVADGKVAKNLHDGSGEFNTVAFSPDGTLLAAGSSDEQVHIWDTAKGKLLMKIGPNKDQGDCTDCSVYSLGFSAAGDSLAVGFGDNLVQTFGLPDGEWQTTFHPDGEYKLSTVAFNPSRDNLATLSLDYILRLWNSKGGEPTFELKAHSMGTNLLAISPDSAYLASAGGSALVYTFSLPGGDLLHTIDLSPDKISQMSFSPDSQTLLTLNDKRKIQYWSMADGKLQNEFEDTGGEQPCVFSPDGVMLACTQKEKEIQIINLEDQSEIYRLKGHSELVFAMVFSPDSKLLLSSSIDGKMRVWRTWDGAQVALIQTPDEDFFDEKIFGNLAMAISPDNELIAAGTLASAVNLYDVEPGKFRLTMDTVPIPFDLNTAMAFSPDSTLLAAGTYLGDIRLWSRKTSDLEKRMEAHTGQVTTMLWSPDGSLLITASEDGTIRVWGVVR